MEPLIRHLPPCPALRCRVQCADVWQFRLPDDLLAQSNNVCSVSKKEIWQHNAVQISSDSGRKLRVSSNAEFPVDVAKVQSEKWQILTDDMCLSGCQRRCPFFGTRLS